MSKKQNKANKLIWGTLGLVVLVGGIVLSSAPGEFFKGQFYFNQDSPEVQEAAKNIDTTMPTDLPAALVVSESTNSPAKLKFDENEKEHLLAVFELKPAASDQKVSINRIVANVAGNNIGIAQDGNISIKGFFAHKPQCEMIDPIDCEPMPEPEATFLPINTVKNPQSDNDLLIEFKSTNDWVIDQADYRYETYGNTYYLAVYSDLAAPKADDVVSTIAGLRYVGNDKTPVGIEGVPTEYEIANVY